MPSDKTAQPWMSYGCLLCGMLLVGSYVGLSKPLTSAIPVFVLAMLRFGIAAIIMLPWTSAPKLTQSAWFTLVIQSFFGNFLFSICMLYGVSLSSAIAAGVIMSTLPAVVALFSRFFLNERLSAQTWLAIGISVVGIVVLQWAGTQSGGDTSGVGSIKTSLLGNSLLFAAVCCEAVYVVTGKRLTNVVSPKQNSALINLIGLVLILPFGLVQIQGFSLTSINAPTWGLLFFYAFAASVGSVWLWMTGMKKVPASQAGVFTIGLPIAAVLVGVLLLGEALSFYHFVAFFCCLAALLLVTLQRLPER